MLTLGDRQRLLSYTNIRRTLSNMPKATATLNGTVLAETDDYEVVEGNIYFPPSSIKKDYFTSTSTSTYCPWKGDASYYSANVDGKEVKDAAWYYAEPLEKATKIKDYVAFCTSSFVGLSRDRRHTNVPGLDKGKVDVQSDGPLKNTITR
jgi:uncharacterized protein (DUF427 family)